jgi:hypothetical protein
MKDLLTKINEAANYIAKHERTTGANYVVVSPKVADAFEEIKIIQDAKNINQERFEKLKKILDED